MEQNNLKINKLIWFPQSLSSTLLGIFVAILSGIVINLLTSGLPQNDYLLIIYFTSLLFFILSSLAALKILRVRMSLDHRISEKRKQNEEAPASKKVGEEILWKETLSDLHIELRDKFLGWKFIGIFSLLIGLILMFLVNILNRSENIKQYNALHEKSDILTDSLTSLQKEISIQNMIIIQINDSLVVFKKEFKLLNKENIKKKKPRTDNKLGIKAQLSP